MKWIFHLPSNFFGLRPKDKANIHKQIFQLVHFGKGFTHDDIYCMPTWLRRFYFRELYDVKEQEKEEMEKVNAKIKNPTPSPRTR